MTIRLSQMQAAAAMNNNELHLTCTAVMLTAATSSQPLVTEPS